MDVFWDLLSANALGAPGKTAVRAGESEISFAVLADLAERIAARLAVGGARPGDRVGIYMPASIEEIAAMFAAARLGCVFVNINGRSVPSQVAHIVTDCGVAALITSPERATTLRNARALSAECDIIEISDDGAEWDETPALEQPCLAAPDDLAALIYTSGSTGSSKGVMLTHANILAGARSVAEYLELSREDRVLAVLPFSFDYGLNQLTTMFLVGGTLVLQTVPMASETARLLAAERITGVGLVPPLWVDLIDHMEAAGASFPDLRYATNTGGKIPDRTLAKMDTVLPGVDIVLMYGLTESFRSTYLPPHLFREKRGAIGIPVPGADIFVVDENTGLCGPDQPGELLHGGAFVSLGYWNRPQETASCIHPNPHLRDLIGDTPVVHSGDTVVADEDGILWFVGRTDGLIKSSGFRISSTEVEDMLLNIDNVAEVCVFGRQNDRGGDTVAAVVRPRDPKSFKIDEFSRRCRRTMPGHMVPQEIHITERAFPRTNNSKIDRKILIAGVDTGRVNTKGKSHGRGCV